MHSSPRRNPPSKQSAAATMLTPGINKAYQQGVARLAGHANSSRRSAKARRRTARTRGRPPCSLPTRDAFAADASLSEEVFGAASLVIRCPDIAAMRAMAERLEGQLTATIQMDKGDAADARTLIPVLERRVGRILVNGYPTGVEVGHAMVHGGPYPATSDGRTTSVGTPGDQALPAAGVLSGYPGGSAAVLAAR